MAIRVVSAYQTLSFDVATMLAPMPSWTLETSIRRRVYARVFDLRTRNEWSKKAVVEIKKQEKVIMVRQWIISLGRPEAPGKLTREAVLPCLDEWMSRKYGGMFFHLTQLVTGHGCFGHYLYKMRKRDSSDCFHCKHDDDTPEHKIFLLPGLDGGEDSTFKKS